MKQIENKYQREHIILINTFNTNGPKMAIKRWRFPCRIYNKARINYMLPTRNLFQKYSHK